ncbi:hypothetical protein Ancab_015779 [Ancistrocladus abbreviatus]
MEKPDLGDRVDSEDPKASELGSSGEKRCPKLKLFGVEINCSGEAAESGNANTAFNLIREEQNEKPLPRSKSLSLTVSLPSSEMLSRVAAFAVIETQEEEANRVRKDMRVLSDVKRPNNKSHCSSSRTKSAATVTPMSGLSAELEGQTSRLGDTDLNHVTQKEHLPSSSLNAHSSEMVSPAAPTTAANFGTAETQEAAKHKRGLSKVNKRLPIKKRDCSSSGIRGGVAAPTSGLSAALRDKIRQLGDDDPKLVIEKKLTACDVNSSQARLTMPGNKTSFFLTDDEREVINSKDEKGNPKGIDTTVIDPSLQIRDIKLRKWCYSSSASYVLVSGWNNVVRHNRLKTGDTVQVWSFRMQGKLGFALVNLGQTTMLALPMHVQWGRTKKKSEPSDI